MNTSLKHLFAKFNETGWQSWSTKSESEAGFKFPVFNFPPKGKGITLASSQRSK